MLNNESVIPILKRLTLKELKNIALNIETEKLKLKQLNKTKLLLALDKSNRKDLLRAFEKVLQTSRTSKAKIL